MEEAVLPHAPPVPDAQTGKMQPSALHIQIIGTNKSKEEIRGEVIIPSFTPFISVSEHLPKIHVFPVWSPAERGKGDELVRTNVGELRMGIKWSPSNVQNPTEGQLMIVIRGVKFYRSKVPEESYLNPKIKILTYDERGKGSEIPR